MLESKASQFQNYVFISRYSRFLPDKKRRETWNETVARYFDFFTIHLKENCGYTLTKDLRLELESAVLNMEVMPSMRCIMTAGEALHRENAAGYNCSFIAIDNQKAFAEIMYVLMNGVGVGFSVERQSVNKLPEIPDELHATDTIIPVRDSKIGWTNALNELISLLYTGRIPKWDLSKIRPKGAILKTFGGRASGPEPLDRLFRFVVKMFEANRGQRLTSLDCHEIACMIGEIVVVGGVRRCLERGYLINTTSGWKQIEDVTPGDKVVIGNEVHNVNNIFDNGIRPTVKVLMSDGTSHVCTEDHKWLVFNHDTNKTEWKEAQELKNGRFSMLKPKKM